MMNRGLYSKYVVTKSDGSATDPNAEYFVLRIDTDPHARAALLTYADRIFDDNKDLAIQLKKWAKSRDVKSFKVRLFSAFGDIVTYLGDWMMSPFLWMALGGYFVFVGISLIQIAVTAAVFFVAYHLLWWGYLMLPKGWKND